MEGEGPSACVPVLGQGVPAFERAKVFWKSDGRMPLRNRRSYRPLKRLPTVPPIPARISARRRRVTISRQRAICAESKDDSLFVPGRQREPRDNQNRQPAFAPRHVR